MTARRKLDYACKAARKGPALTTTRRSAQPCVRDLCGSSRRSPPSLTCNFGDGTSLRLIFKATCNRARSCTVLLLRATRRPPRPTAQSTWCQRPKVMASTVCAGLRSPSTAWRRLDVVGNGPSSLGLSPGTSRRRMVPACVKASTIRVSSTATTTSRRLTALVASPYSSVATWTICTSSPPTLMSIHSTTDSPPTCRSVGTWRTKARCPTY